MYLNTYTQTENFNNNVSMRQAKHFEILFKLRLFALFCDAAVIKKEDFDRQPERHIRKINSPSTNLSLLAMEVESIAEHFAFGLLFRSCAVFKCSLIAVMK